MGLRSAAEADRLAVFLADEFGEEASVDGTTVTAVLDRAERGARDLDMGLPSDGLTLFARTEDLPPRRSPGEGMVVNGTAYVIESWREDLGVSEVSLVRAG